MLTTHYMRRPVRLNPDTGWSVTCSCGWSAMVKGKRLRARNAWLAHAGG
jgi:hypothetical protein